MNTLIISNYSYNIAKLNTITAPNKEAYAKQHGYEFENHFFEYNGEGHIGWLCLIADKLSRHDIVMTVGCDVLFMNFEREIDPAPDASITLAREHISWWPINNDVMIWQNTPEARGVLSRLIKDAPIWLQYPWLWQNHIWNLMQTEMAIDHAIDIREAREMNACLQGGLGQWQLGDWILHLLNMKTEEKIPLAKDYLRLAGNGVYYPQIK